MTAVVWGGRSLRRVIWSFQPTVEMQIEK